MAVSLQALPPLAAIAALEARGNRLSPSFAYQDVWEQEHAAQFTVAKSAGFDILNDVHSGLLDALKQGRTVRQFTADLRPLLEAKGWWGRRNVVDPASGDLVSAQLGSARRLETIFDANMRVSYAAGHWSHFERNKATRPFLRYVAVMDERTRPEHAARHNLCLPVDHPYWNVWAPPCGWACRCTLQSMSQRDVDRMRGQLKFEPPPDEYRDWTNRRTGEVLRVPVGIDPGWAHNPGKAGHQAVVAADRLVAAPAPLAAAAVADPAFPVARLVDEYSAWADDVSRGRPVDRALWPLGALKPPVLEALGRIGLPPATGGLTIHRSIARRLLQSPDLPAMLAAALRRLPQIIAEPRAVLFDKVKPSLLYVIEASVDDPSSMIVVRIASATSRRADAGIAPLGATVREVLIVPRAELGDPAAYELLTGSIG